MIINAEKGVTNFIGRLGENEARVVRFPIREMLNDFPGCTFTLANRRPNDADAYPSPNIAVNGDFLDWTVTSGDLASVGFGECEVIASVDGNVMKSDIYQTVIKTALDDSGTVPEPWESWVTQVTGAAEQAEAAVEHYPRIENGVWMVWDAENETWTSTGVQAEGQPGRDGQDGAPGAPGADGKDGKDGKDGQDGQDGAPGADGYSPTASVSKSGKVATITITDKNGTTTEQISDGEDGAGADLIDDTAGEGDTDKVWSADKTDTEVKDLKSALTQTQDDVSDVKTAIQGINEQINGETTYTEETWTGTLESGRYDKTGSYTASSDYRSATVDLDDVVSMKVTATDAAGTSYALIVYENDSGTVVGTAFDCDGTRRTYVEQLVETFPTGATKAIIVHYRTLDYLTPTIVLRKEVSTDGLKDDVENLEVEVAANTNSIGTLANLQTTEKTNLVGAINEIDTEINGGTTLVNETWDGEFEKGRYDKSGNYSATNEYRSATVDLIGVVSLKVTAIDAAGTSYALIVYKNNLNVVVGTAFDCDGTRRTYENQVVNTFPTGATKAIIVHYRTNAMLLPTIVMTKQVINSGINGDVQTLVGTATLAGKKIVCFGDSIFGIHDAPYDIPTFLSKYTGAICHNAGFSGAWMSDRQSQTGYNAFSFNHIVDSIVAEDFTEQEEAFVITPDLPAQYRTNLTTLEGIDFNTVDIVTIAYGTNDFMSSLYYENQSDNHDVTTIFGSLRHCIEALLTKFPQIRIFVCGQTYRFWLDNDGNFDYDSNTYERGDHTTLIDMVEKTRKVAEEYNLPFIDNYIPLGINQYNCFQYFPSNDGTHHNINGVKLIAQHMAHELF